MVVSAASVGKASATSAWAGLHECWVPSYLSVDGAESRRLEHLCLRHATAISKLILSPQQLKEQVCHEQQSMVCMQISCGNAHASAMSCAALTLNMKFGGMLIIT